MQTHETPLGISLSPGPHLLLEPFCGGWWLLVLEGTQGEWEGQMI